MCPFLCCFPFFLCPCPKSIYEQTKSNILMLLAYSYFHLVSLKYLELLTEVGLSSDQY